MSRIQRIQNDDLGSGLLSRPEKVLQPLRGAEQMPRGSHIDQQMVVGRCTEATSHDGQATDELRQW
jgi:hypothetical protein